MIKTHHIILIFIPAILLVGITLFIRIIQYQSLYQKDTQVVTNNENNLPIPIFSDDAIIGDKRAPITLIAFEDLGCEACAAQNILFDELLAKYPKKVKIIWKGLPVTRFPVATDQAHEYAYCAALQNKFVPFKQQVYANNSNLTPAIVEQMAVEAGVNIDKVETCIATGAPQQYIENTKQLAKILQIPDRIPLR